MFNSNNSCLDLGALINDTTDVEKSDNLLATNESFGYETNIEEDDDELQEVYKMFSGKKTVLVKTEFSVASSVLLLK